MIKWIKKRKIDIILNMIYIFMFIVFFICITKNGEYIYGSRVDFKHQHYLLPEYIRSLFYSTHNLFPSFAPNLGGGQNIYSISYYGLYSPMILLSYLFPNIKMINYIIIIMSIIVLSSTTLFYTYLRKHNYSYLISFLCGFLLLTASPFLFHSHRHIMFINYMPFLILALFGMDKYIYQKKSSLLIISTTLIILTSYYYSVSSFCVLFIYGIYLNIKNKNTYKWKIKDFFDYCFSLGLRFLVSVMISSILTIPTLYTLLFSRGSDSNNLLLKDLIPNISLLYSKYSMGLTLISLISLLYMIFIGRKKENKFLSITILIISSFPIFSYILNGFLYVNQKVLIPFIPITLLLVADFLKRIFKSKKCIIPVTGYILISSTCICMYINSHEHFIPSTEINNKFYQNYDKLIDDLNKADDNVYRTRTSSVNDMYINKVGSPLEYKTTLYSSTFNEEYEYAYKNLFNNPLQKRNKFMFSSSPNIFFEIYMGEKNIVTRNSNLNENIYTKVKKYDDIYFYKNNYVLPIGYATKENINVREFDKLNLPEKSYNILGRTISNRKTNTDIKKIQPQKIDYSVISSDKISYTKKDDYYTINSKKNGTMKLHIESNDINDSLLWIIFDIKPSDKDDLGIKINGISNLLTCHTWKYYNENEKFSFVILNHENNDLKIKFKKGKYRIKNINIYTINYNDIRTISQKVTPLKIDKSKTKGDNIYGTIDVKEDSYFTLSIPYDKGFEIYVDNKKTDYEEVNKSYIGFSIKKGKHDIRIKYTSPFKKISLIISVIGTIILTIVIVKERVKDKQY